MKKLLTAVALPALMLLCNLAAFGQYDEHVVAGFYPYMKNYILKPEEIKLQQLTHLIYCFAGPREDGSISTESGSYHNPALVQKAHSEGRKFIVMMGGGLQSGGFHGMTSSAQTRQIFINNLTDWCKTYGYDGVTLDWEYPGANNKDEDRDNLTNLVVELRAAFDALETELGKELEISMAVHSSLYYASWVDFHTLKNYVDWFGLMSYDYAGNWAYCLHAAHNAPLFCGPPEICDRYLNVDLGVKNLRDSLGIPSSQIVMGLAFYGREFYNSELYETPREGGQGKPYYDIEPLINNGWERIWDEDSKVPYLKKTSGSGIISYDDEESLKNKTDYIKDNNLLGAMIWEITQDVSKTNGNQPLLQAVANELIDTPIDNEGTPSITITSPANGSSFAPGSSVEIKTNTSITSPFAISKVEFFAGSTLIGSSTTAPFSFIWENIPFGNFALTAKATATSGKTKTSAAINIYDNSVPELTEMFDDFNYTNADDPALSIINRWSIVDGISGPPSNANYDKNNITFYQDTNDPNNTIMGVATTASPSEGTTHARIETSDFSYQMGTFAARVYFDDTPATYNDGNVETFYTINSYATCGQADLYSEVDFEYLPWDAWHYERKNTMYMTTWETCYDRTHEKSVTSFEGWHLLQFTALANEPVKFYIDGELLYSIADDIPDSDQNISFANWIYQNIVGSSTETRTTKMQVDWVYHAVNETLSPLQVAQKVNALRAAGILRKNIDGEMVTSGIAPTVTLTSPANGDSFIEGNAINISANASDQDGSIDHIDFYVNSSLVGSCSESACSIQWTANVAGQATITAKAYDNTGLSSTSQAVNITIDEAYVPRPTVKINSPANGSAIDFNSPFTIAAIASDSTGEITKVEFYINNSLIQTDSQSPYELTYQSAISGNYQLYAIAYNSSGFSKQSSTVNFAIKENPAPQVTIISPANNSTIAADSEVNLEVDAYDTDGEIVSVDYYDNGNLIASTPSPFTFTYSTNTLGNHEIVAIATDNDGLTASDTANINIADITISLNVEYKTIVSWDTGFQGQITVTNNSEIAVSNWTVTFSSSNNIAPLWGANIASHEGSLYTIIGDENSNTIPAGSSIVFGFIGNTSPGGTLSYPEGVSVTHTTLNNSRRGHTLKDSRHHNLAYPNPFLNGINISVYIATEDHVAINIIDMNGQKVATISDKVLKKGTYTFHWNAGEYPAGPYFIKFLSNKNKLKPIMLLKK